MSLGPELMARHKALLEQAEKLAGDDPDLLLRVQIAHLPVQTTQIALLPTDDPKRAGVLKRYLALVAKAGIRRYGEWTSMDQFRASAAK